MSWALGSGGGREDEMADVRADEVNAITLLFLRYGRDEWPQFAIGGIASVIARALELVPAFILGLAIDALFTRGREFTLPLVSRELIPPTMEGQFFLAVGLIGGTYLLGAGLILSDVTV